MLNTEIRNKIQSLWDRLWSGGLANPITAIEQISYLLFMKRLEKFQPDVPDNFKWSNYHNLEGEELLQRIKEEVFEYIRNDLAENDEPFAKAMQDTSFKINNPTLLKDAIRFIDGIYSEIEEQESQNQHFQDIQGDVYEHLLKHTSEAGKNGQFRTPRHIIQMMAELLDPDVDGKICDLASGSAGFLVGAFQYIITKYSKNIEFDENGLEKGLDGNNLTEDQRNKLKQNTFIGFDIDQTMVRIGMMNLMMHGIQKPQIIHLDTLSKEYEKFEFEQNIKDIGKAFEQGELKFKDSSFAAKDFEKGVVPETAEKYKYILANPPFTGKINSLTVSENLDRIYPPKYEDREKTIRKKQTVQSELLFLERIVYMLDEGGRAAIIVPEGVLFNSGKVHKEIREILMTDCNLEGVVSMPSGVFQPYTGVKTSILLFTKRKLKNGKDNPQNIDVWFYGMESDGYTLDTNRKRLKESPLPEVIKQWKNRANENQLDRKHFHFNIPFEEIKNNGFELNFNLYKNFVYEPQEFEPSNSILKKIMELELEINRGLEDLKIH